MSFVLPPSLPGRPDRFLVLASTSRYRRALLERLGLPFATLAPATDESPLPGEAPAATALRLAEAKARSVATALPAALVVGSDQVADADGEPVGKPGSAAAAKAQLLRLSGRVVVFHTGIALVDAPTGLCRSAVVDVRSRFRKLSASTIDAYVAREEPYDCAGSVKSEGLGIVLFEAIESDDPTALIGLPLIRLATMLGAAGVAIVG
jgi:septum formation protein